MKMIPMKKYLFLLWTAACSLVAACSSDQTESEYPDKLQVELSPTWDTTRGMTSASQTASVAVTLNVQSVHWTVASDSDWCRVDDQTSHVGDGEFTVEVTANEQFNTRNAVITLSAGAFSCRMEVDQTGKTFILDKTYAVVSPNQVQPFDVVVRSLSEWQPVDSEWLHGEIINSSEPDDEGMITSTLRIRCDDNANAEGRYATLTIEPTNGVGYGTDLAVYQFGSEVAFDAEGNLTLAAQGENRFEIVSPAHTVVDITCPEWISHSDQTDGERTTYTFSASENPSDTKSAREGVIELSIKDVALKTLLPTVKQEFYPVHGIVSGAGLKMFAEAFNAGEDLSDWTSADDGVTVEILGDIDMSQVEWSSIGSAERPFDGILAGNGHAIRNWNASQPLFAHTGPNAVISDLTIDASSRFNATTIASGQYVAPLIGICNGTLSNCRNQAPVSLTAEASVEGACGVGGLVGMLDQSGRMENCTNEGLVSLGSQVICNNLSIGGLVARTQSGSSVKGCSNEGAIASNGATTADNTNNYLYTGGIAGYAGGTIENCATRGSKSIALTVTAAYATSTGGIAGRNDDSLNGCTNEQPIILTISRKGDACRYMYAGGIAGRSTGALSENRNRGEISIAAICKFVVAGGICGLANAPATNVVNEANITLLGNPGGANGPLKEEVEGPRYVYIGGVVGQLMGSGSITGNNSSTNSGAIAINQMEQWADNNLFTGGIAGYDKGGRIADVVNDGSIEVTAGPSSGKVAWNIRSLGGIVGYADVDGISISGAKNNALISHDRLSSSRANAMPVYMGGIIGYLYAANAEIADCINSGELNGDYYNNNIEYDGNVQNEKANCVGGIAGAIVAPEGSNTLRKCENAGTLTIYRGMGGGIAAYAEAALITGCTNRGEFAAANRNGRSGGIAAQAMNTRIEECLNRATVSADGTGSATNNIRLGGVVGYLSGNSSVSDSRHFGTLFSRQYGQKSLFEGGIAGVSDAGTSIENCYFGGELKGESESRALTSDDICSDANFSGSGNQLWDGE